jgi:hypothetical protein
MLRKILLLITVSPLFFSTVLLAYPNDNEQVLRNSTHSHIEQQDLQEVGHTTFSIFFWDLYKSSLQTTSGTYPIDAEKEQLLYEINYLADISSKDLIERTIEQWQHLEVPTEHYQQFVHKLTRIWPDITKGDKLSLRLHNNISFFYFNEKYIGRINDPMFGQLFLDIWLAENTSQPTLRNELLGKK